MQCARGDALGFTWLGVAQPEEAGPNYSQEEPKTAAVVIRANPPDLTITTGFVSVHATYMDEEIWSASHALCDATPLGLGAYCPPVKDEELLLAVPIDVLAITSRTYQPVKITVTASFEIVFRGALRNETVSCKQFDYRPPAPVAAYDSTWAVGMAIVMVLLTSLWLLSKHNMQHII